ncbi:MAG TPA: plasmid mobilization relaxosome protein MobC [Streptosporangiaceae bacterium]
MSEQATRRVPAARNGAARLHRVEGGRRHAVKVRLDDAEYDAIVAHAADSKVSIQRLLVTCALTRTLPAIPAQSALIAELVGLRRLAANLANNVNQIARRLNSGGFPDSSIPAAAVAVRRAMLRLDSALTGLTAESSAPPATPSAQAVAAPSAPQPRPGSRRPSTPPLRNAPQTPP